MRKKEEQNSNDGTQEGPTRESIYTHREYHISQLHTLNNNSYEAPYARRIYLDRESGSATFYVFPLFSPIVMGTF